MELLPKNSRKTVAVSSAPPKDSAGSFVDRRRTSAPFALNREACYRSLQCRDPRFDGLFFVAVTSTGIYCRPVCPARTPKFGNCRFYASAAAAQEAGFRPCLRCRPETAPDFPSWRGTPNTVFRALALIGEGALDRPGSAVDQLAERLGIGERQLRRLFEQHLGTSPITVAQTRRVLFAKQLIQETRLPMTQVALAAGFGSIRRFNETFLQLFGRPPSQLRRKAASARDSAESGGVSLRVRYRPPYDWPAMLDYLEARAIEGVEIVENGVYRRTVAHDGEMGTVEVAHDPSRNSLIVILRFRSVRALPSILARVRRVFDTGADIQGIEEHLSRDPFLAPLVAQRPGLRAPGGWDGFELAVRAVLGQQITVVGARQLARHLVRLCGSRLSAADRQSGVLTHAFPSPEQVATADLRTMPMPESRRASLAALAVAAVEDPSLFRPFGTLEEAIARLRSIRGVGEWTAQYIALRALREPDAFPASDIGLLRGAANGSGQRPTPSMLLQRAEPWRPWRAYAAQHLWVVYKPEVSLG
jgi:AraC family transcriptional regulator of adaptative response / DNA-3-methyladenine glycosylase II